MMKKLHSIALVMTIFINTSLYSQTGIVSIGEKIPVIEFDSVINTKNPSYNLRNSKSKLTILNFWNPACPGNQKNFQTIDSLQSTFSDKVHIILVNLDTKDSTLKYLLKRKDLKFPKAIMLTSAHNLISQLPKEGYPYSIWLDSTLTVRYITPSYNITIDNINAFLNGIKSEMVETGKPIFRGPLIEYLKSNTSVPVEYFCFITKCIPGLDIGNTRSIFNDSTLRISASCQSIVELYKRAYSEFNKYKFTSPSSIILNVKDSSRYLRPVALSNFDTWQKSHSYNFDMIIPAAQKEKAYYIMQQQLWIYFQLKAKVETRIENNKKMDTLILQE